MLLTETIIFMACQALITPGVKSTTVVSCMWKIEHEHTFTFLRLHDIFTVDKELKNVYGRSSLKSYYICFYCLVPSIVLRGQDN